MTYLFAGNERQARYYADKHHLDMSKTRIVTGAEQLFGTVHGTLLVLCGQWRYSPQVDEVIATATRNELMVVKEVDL